MNIINIICLWTGYILYGSIALFTFLWLYFHLWLDFTFFISQIIFCRRSNVKIQWFKFLWSSVKNLRHLWQKETRYHYDVGIWEAPRHIYSLGTYTFYKKKAEKTIDNEEKSL